jgi:hypothetical protein
MVKTFGLWAPLFLLMGCATCREHPVACTVVLSVVATSAALAYYHHENQTPVAPLPQDHVLPIVHPLP